MDSEITKLKFDRLVPQDESLYPCVPIDWLWLPKPFRRFLAWTTIMLFCLSFFSIPISFFLFVPIVWTTVPMIATVYALTVFLSLILPPKEWPLFRKVGQLWYEEFQFSSNISNESISNWMNYAENRKIIFAMHPHGIVPFQAILWAAFCDQYLCDSETGKKLYGFGAAADIVMYIPFLRNIIAWLSGGSASYKPLKDGLLKGLAPSVNAAGRKPQNLFILPGGIAEIFCSKPANHTIVLKNRKGLVKLAVETNADMCPCYVFGGTDFFYNLATNQGFLSSFSRKFRIGFTLFWGRWRLPIPFAPRVTMVIGRPIAVPHIPDDDEKKSQTIEAMHAAFLSGMTALFDKYKAAAGYPDALLEIQ